MLKYVREHADPLKKNENISMENEFSTEKLNVKDPKQTNIQKLLKEFEEKFMMDKEIITCELCKFEIKGNFEKHEKSYRHQRKVMKARKKLSRFIRRDRKRIQKKKGFYGINKGIKKLVHFRRVYEFEL